MDASPTMVAVDPRHVSYTHLMYGLHATSIAIGLLTSAFAVGWFVFGWPSIVAIIMNYVRRGAVRGTWLDAHFRWQRRTFWTAAVVIIGVTPLMFTFILIPLVRVVYIVMGLWAAYRIGRGWLALRNGRSLPA